MPPQYTTQDCANCGYRVPKTLSTRTHVCPKCGFELDRDHNATLNILKKGLSILGVEWQNISSGHERTASQWEMLGEIGTSAMDGKPEMVSAVDDDSRHSSSLSKHNSDRVRAERFTDLFIQRSQRATTVRPTAGFQRFNFFSLITAQTALIPTLLLSKQHKYSAGLPAVKLNQ